MTETLVELRPEERHYGPDGTVLNSRLPLLIYRNAVAAGPDGDVESAMLDSFRRNDWLNNWRYRGVYEYAHFHSTTHEVLGVVRGEMLLRLGGAGEPETVVRVGDVIVVPAGVSHMSVGGSDDVFMVGGYPEGRDWDLMVDGEVSDAEMRAAYKRIMSLPIPRQDPVTGEPMHAWRNAPSSLEWGQGVALSTGIPDVTK
jgi:uncharacterized protein YjlB